MLKKVTYIDKENKDYYRAYSTTAIVNLNANGDVVVDFCEEYVQPSLLTSKDIEQENDEFSHPIDELKIIRDLKFSVVMNPANAINMAKMILQKYGQEGDINGENNQTS